MKHKKYANLYRTWSKYLTFGNITHTVEDFNRHVDPQRFKSFSPTALSFFIERYLGFLTERECIDLWESYKIDVKKRRGSPYDVDNVMKKKGMTREEAEKEVERRKSVTNITEENMIRKYGEEEGKRRYAEFVRKSASTKENFQERFGDDWEERWNHYMATRDSQSLEFFIKKYGKDDGPEEYRKYHDARGKSLTKEGFVERYGDEGEQKYEEVCKSKVHSLEKSIELYGEEEGTRKWNETCFKKGKANTLEGMIERHGEEEGKRLYAERSMRVSPVFAELKKLHGEEEAIKRYQNLPKADRKIKSKSKRKQLGGMYRRSSKGPTSKEANRFLEALQEQLGRELVFGSKKDELKLFNEEHGKLFHYDGYDPASNTIIEVHGVAFHPKPGDTDWIGPYGATYDEKRTNDILKEETARKEGYNYIVVWSDEINGPVKAKLKAIKLLENLNESI